MTSKFDPEAAVRTFTIVVTPTTAGTITNSATDSFGNTATATVEVQEVPTPPAPTSEDYCKNDGYKTFGFKNQGQCIASLKG